MAGKGALEVVGVNVSPKVVESDEFRGGGTVVEEEAREDGNIWDARRAGLLGPCTVS